MIKCSRLCCVLSYSDRNGRDRHGQQNMKRKTVVVNDKMQKGYVYELVEPMGKNFSPGFKPEISPKEMLQLGVFGGKYMTDCQQEFPRSWFEKAKLNSKIHDASLNFFKVNASQSLKVWREKGWINSLDPRGWFQWYCRSYLRRRCEDDERQIKRWKMMKRHVVQIENGCLYQDWNCRKKQRQAVLHWAYDSRKI